MPEPASLRRELGVWDAALLGLGSIVGTGVFVSLGVAAGIAGPAVVLAVVIAGCVAACNALSSAQLAAHNPVSGGTYEYGYRYLSPRLGFTAGWLFLLAKSASAATAALGFGGYLSAAAGLDSGWRVPLACAAAAGFTLLVLSGIRRSATANTVIVGVTIACLAWFVLGGLPAALTADASRWQPFFSGPEAGGEGPARALLHACALMFVAFTGYGRVATLGEEVREPRQTIPRAIILTLLVSALLYAAVAAVGVGAAGVDVLSAGVEHSTAPLVFAAQEMALPGGALVLTVGATTAMLGVLLNLILGLSRVLLAMGRRGDMPAGTARLNKVGTTPTVAVAVVGAGIVGLTLVGDVRTTWSFSAFTVLVYYALTNLAALRMPAEERLYPRWVAMVGLASCLFLAWWVEPVIWGLGLGLIGAGLVWHAVRQPHRELSSEAQRPS